MRAGWCGEAGRRAASSLAEQQAQDSPALADRSAPTAIVDRSALMYRYLHGPQTAAGGLRRGLDLEVGAVGEEVEIDDIGAPEGRESAGDVGPAVAEAQVGHLGEEEAAEPTGPTRRPGTAPRQPPRTLDEVRPGEQGANRSEDVGGVRRAVGIHRHHERAGRRPDALLERSAPALGSLGHDERRGAQLPDDVHRAVGCAAVHDDDLVEPGGHRRKHPAQAPGDVDRGQDQRDRAPLAGMVAATAPPHSRPPFVVVVVVAAAALAARGPRGWIIRSPRYRWMPTLRIGLVDGVTSVFRRDGFSPRRERRRFLAPSNAGSGPVNLLGCEHVDDRARLRRDPSATRPVQLRGRPGRPGGLGRLLHAGGGVPLHAGRRAPDRPVHRP